MAAGDERPVRYGGVTTGPWAVYRDEGTWMQGTREFTGQSQRPPEVAEA
jgi:hypothetical protein